MVFVLQEIKWLLTGGLFTSCDVMGMKGSYNLFLTISLNYVTLRDLYIMCAIYMVI